VLTIIGDKAAPEFRSGALNLERKIMSGIRQAGVGKQDFLTFLSTVANCNIDINISDALVI
jgi:hypothetical protein